MVAECELQLLCFALRMRKGALLPTALYEIPETVGALADAFREHYLAIGKPLTAKSQSMECLMLGYYHLNEETKKITCVLDRKREKTQLNFDYATKIEILEPLDMDTGVQMTVAGRQSVLPDIMEEFEAEDVTFPDGEWKGEFTKNERGEKPEKKKAKIEPASSSAASPSKPGNAVLSSALRQRLAVKTPQKKEAKN